MIRTIRFPRIRRRSLLTLFAAMLLAVAVACGGSDEPAEPTQIPSPTSVPAPPPVALGDGVTVEPGSDEAEIVALWERLVVSMRTRDFAEYHAGCRPDLQAKISVEDIAAAFERESNNPVYGRPVFTPEANVVLHEFRKFRDTMTVTWDWLEGEDVIGSGLGEGHDRVDGKWYLSGGICSG